MQLNLLTPNGSVVLLDDTTGEVTGPERHHGAKAVQFYVQLSGGRGIIVTMNLQCVNCDRRASVCSFARDENAG
jgi:hypothetical protein